MTAASTPVRAGLGVARGKSKQDYGTPWEFIEAVEKRFGPLLCDLAAHRENAKCTRFFGEETNSLSRSWAKEFPMGTLWLNPPFANIEPWAAKLAAECRFRQGFTAFLTPASIGSEWFADHVLGKAMVLGLRPRIPFDGMPVNPNTGKVDGYPKDLMLSVYGFGLHGFDTWRWKP